MTFSIGIFYNHLDAWHEEMRMRIEIWYGFFLLIIYTSLRHTKTISTHRKTFENWDLGTALINRPGVAGAVLQTPS